MIRMNFGVKILTTTSSGVLNDNVQVWCAIPIREKKKDQKWKIRTAMLCLVLRTPLHHHTYPSHPLLNSLRLWRLIPNSAYDGSSNTYHHTGIDILKNKLIKENLRYCYRKFRVHWTRRCKVRKNFTTSGIRNVGFTRRVTIDNYFLQNLTL